MPKPQRAVLAGTSVPSLDGLYSAHVNPQWVKLLNILQMNVQYERCTASELFTTDGRRILDFLSGYCVHNTGHNHPAIIAALKEELDRSGPAMLQSHVPQLAAQLAQRLVQLAGGKLQRVYFTNSGSEGVETAIKFSRAHTRRDGLALCRGRIPRLDVRRAFADERSVLERGLRPHAARHTGRPVRRRDRTGAAPGLAQVRGVYRGAGAVRRRHQGSRLRTTFSPPRSSAAGTARSSFSTKCRPACTAPDRSSPRTALRSNPTW